MPALTHSIQLRRFFDSWKDSLVKTGRPPSTKPHLYKYNGLWGITDNRAKADYYRNLYIFPPVVGTTLFEAYANWITFDYQGMNAWPLPNFPCYYRPYVDFTDAFDKGEA